MDITLLRDKIRHDGGGASRSIHLLAENLVERGHNVEVITVHFSGEKNNILDNYNYTLTEKPINNQTQIDGAIQIHRILNQLDSADILHCFQPQLHPIVSEWKRKNPETAVVGRLNTYENFCTNHALIENQCYKNCTLRKKWNHHPEPTLGSLPKMAFDTWIQPHLLNRFDRLFALSPDVAEIFTGYGIDGSRLEVIPNFYEKSFCAENTNKEFGKSTNKDYRIIYVGRIVKEKGVDLLLEAVTNAQIDVEVDIVGDGPELEALKRNSPEEVVFHGWVEHEELNEYYYNADVFVHPGLWPEPFGRTVLEAMQCGCVPVVSDTGGPPWIVGDAGLTFPRGDADSLATVLESLGNVSVFTKHQAKIQKELERFTSSQVINQVVTEYERIVE